MEADEIRISKIADDLLSTIGSNLSIILHEDNHQPSNTDPPVTIPQSATFQTLITTVEQFQPCPQLIDPKLRNFIERLVTAYVTNSLSNEKNNNKSDVSSIIGELFYTFTKVRGVKTVSNCLSSDIYLLTSVIDRLQSSELKLPWQERFFLLVWLSVLILVPFPLLSLSTDLPTATYNLSLVYLESSGKENDASCLLLARLLSRDDCSKLFMDRFITENFNTLEWEQSGVAKKVGLLKVINYLLKMIDVASMEPYLQRILTLISNELNDDGDGERNNGGSMAIARYYVKILGKLSLMFCKLQEYDPIEELVDMLVLLVGHDDGIVRYSVAKQVSKITVVLDDKTMKRDIILYFLNDLEINNLDLSDGPLRLDLNVDYETLNVEKYHGIVLTLGEFARHRLLSSNGLLNGCISILHKTLFAEQHRLTHSVGGSVRDASCFVAWSLAKKYKTVELHSKLWVRLFTDLLVTCCFDRDLMIRRAASAAVQELVGRHGDVILPEMIKSEGDNIFINEYKVKLIEILDYTALGQLSKSFGLSLKITGDLSQLMQFEFIDELINHGIVAADYEVRKLSSVTLRDSLAVLNDSTVVISTLTSLLKRLGNEPTSGLLYAIAELLVLLPPEASVDFSNLEGFLRSVKFDYHCDPYYKGEEYIHVLTKLLESHIQFELTTSEYECVFTIVRMSQDSITHKFIEFTKVLTGVPKVYRDRWVYYIRNGNLNAAKAIGYNVELLKDILDDVLGLVEGGKNVDAELRSSLIDSLSMYLCNVAETGDVDDSLLRRLVCNLDDYTITNRGDVGSYIRSSTIDLISDNILVFKNSSTAVVKEVEMKLVRLTGEVMNKIRLKALKLLLVLKNWESYYIDYSTSNNLSISDDLFGGSGDKQQLLFVSETDYYMFLLTVYKDKYLDCEVRDVSREFFKGYSFSGGSLQAIDPTINSSVYAFMKMWQSLNYEQRTYVLTDLLSILKVDKTMTLKNVVAMKVERFNKTQSSCLKFWCNLLELNMPIPETNPLNALFVRTYNLTLGSSNLPKLFTSIRVFTCLHLRDPVKFADCKKRLTWLSEKHPIMKVRNTALGALKEIDYEINV